MTQMKKGLVCKIVKNQYYVQIDNKLIVSTVIGKWHQKTNAKSIFVGDRVTLLYQKEADHYQITDVLARENQMFRPRIANIDLILFLCSFKTPNLNYFQINQYLMYADYLEIPILLLLTKKDLQIDDIKTWNIIKRYETLGYEVMAISNFDIACHTKELLKHRLKDKFVVLAGNSGVGKSTFLNEFTGKYLATVGEISTKLQRGKHETTFSNIYWKNHYLLADTPGFTAFHIPKTIDKYRFAQTIRPFSHYFRHCHYNNCLHFQENKCYIKYLVSKQQIDKLYYEDYLTFLRQF